jgi:hypothetical protein
MAIQPRIQIVHGNAATATGKTDRVGRYPKHTFNVAAKPFSIQPLGIAPVLPGETFSSLFYESRAVTDPIKSPIIGWKKDYFFFYVRATALLGEAIRNMFVDLHQAQDPAVNVTDLSTTNGLAANDIKYYTAKGGVPYLELAIKYITEKGGFRDEGQLWDTVPTINGYPAAQIRENSWMDTLLDKDLVPDQAAFDTAGDVGDLERLLSAYEQLRSLGLANITWEDYLASFGINPDVIEDVKPELLHHSSDFQYPSNTVNPADGSVASAVSWVFRQGEQKKRKFFKEPGFVVGFTVVRPKIYFAGLAGNMTAHLTRAWDWLPELLIDMPQHSLKKFDVDTGPLGTRNLDTDAYFADMRDLFMHGDQFQNRVPFDPAVAADFSAINGVHLPAQDLNWRYPTEAMVNSFFSGGANGFVREDGYFSLSIKGKQRDASPGRSLIGLLPGATV